MEIWTGPMLHAYFQYIETSRLHAQAGLYIFLLPSLFFTYLGQAAYLIADPTSASSLYYNSLPRPIYWPMFVVATLAAIVASQVQKLLTCICFDLMNLPHDLTALSKWHVIIHLVVCPASIVLESSSMQSVCAAKPTPHRVLRGPMRQLCFAHDESLQV